MTNLNHRAMLVTFTRRVWQAAASDRDLARKMENEAGAQSGTMKAIKTLAPKDYLSPIQHLADFGYAEHNKMTVPGFVRGQSLLCSTMLERYTAVHFEIGERFNRKVMEFCEFYPTIRKIAPARLGSSFKERDFPDVRVIKDYFEYKVAFAPVPAVEDWRIEGLADDDMERFRQEAKDTVGAMYAEATKTVFDRVHKMLHSIHDQAVKYEGGPGANLLRDATIDMLKEIGELSGMMNISADPVLKEISETMVKEFQHLDGKELRRSPEQRADVATAAKKLIAMMKGRVNA